jgi:hypothetical protein
MEENKFSINIYITIIHTFYKINEKKNYIKESIY